MVNVSERLINVVIVNKLKALTGLNQKVRSKDEGLRVPLVVVNTLSANRADLTHLGTEVQHGKPVVLPLGKQAVRQADRTAGKGGGSKRKPSCSGVDRD